MQITNANFLVEDEWKDMYDFEKRLVRSIPRIAQAATSEELRPGLLEPLEVTRNQAQRIGQGLESAARRVELYGRAPDAAAHAVAGGFCSRTGKRSGRREDKQMPAAKRWSQAVTTHSNALDLEPGVFELDSPTAIAESLKRSADRSTRCKTTPFQSAMSMLNFYINRAGKNLPEKRLHLLEKAKNELRKLYGRPTA